MDVENYDVHRVARLFLSEVAKVAPGKGRRRFGEDGDPPKFAHAAEPWPKLVEAALGDYYEHLKQLKADLPGKDWELLDVAYRFKGTGSLGRLRFAALLADGLLDGGVMWRVRSAGGKVQEYRADRDCLFRGWPLAVLVGDRTIGSGPEMLAAALNNLGAALLSSKRAREALEPLQRAIQIKPLHVLAYVNMGFVYADLGEPAEALRCFRRAIILQYDTPQAWVGLARVHQESGQPGPARTAWGILGQFDGKLAGSIGPAFLQTW